MARQKRSTKPPAKRAYTLRQRQASMDETRARILDAALELYETVGPAATSMSAIAARAGVTRGTLYRHFQTDDDLASAVIDEWRTGGSSVDEAALSAIGDPTMRLRAGLTGLYGGYRATDRMTANLLRDVHALPATRQPDLRSAAGRVRDALTGTGVGGGDSPLAAAAVGHAVAFETWRSLSAEGLDDRAIVDLMLVFVAGAAAGSSRKSSARSAANTETPRPRISAGHQEAEGTRPDRARAAYATMDEPPRKEKGGKARHKGGGGKKNKGGRKAKKRETGRA